MTKRNTLGYAALAVSALAYLALGYATPRTAFPQLLLLYSLVFAAYVYLLNRRFPLWHGIGAAMLFRLLFLFAVPALSDDFYRFVWDGRLLAAGLNPYLYLPSFLAGADGPQVPGITAALYQQLNSPGYYSVYPPVTQAFFWLSVQLSPDSLLGSIVVMRLVVIAAEAGTILLLLRLLRKMALPERHVLLYALNPLVILELTGNLHPEALLIFFLLLSLYQLIYQRLLPAGAAFGLAVSAKLLPLMFLPLLLRKLSLKRFLLFGGAVLAAIVATFLPLFSVEVVQHIFRSLNLYFQKFEFNAGMYYLLRWLGFRLTGYNQITLLGPLLSLTTFIVIVALSTVKKLGSIRRLSGYMAAALTVYLFLATTVHPWYLATLVALTALSHFRYAVVWSGLAMLTYATYRTTPYHEDLGLVALEYSIVFLWLLVELYFYRRRRRNANLPG